MGQESGFTADMYQNLIVRTRTPLAQLLPVPATALVSGLSTMIITSHTIRVGADRGDLIAYRRHGRI
jgi:hypothetical protein